MKLTRWRKNHVASRMKMLSRTNGGGMVQEIDPGLFIEVRASAH
jgi:hypothetical protein